MPPAAWDPNSGFYDNGMFVAFWLAVIVGILGLAGWARRLK
jgi:hypothetical protein